jgi:hypothetical protein
MIRDKFLRERIYVKRTDENKESKYFPMHFFLLLESHLFQNLFLFFLLVISWNVFAEYYTQLFNEY